MYIFPRNLILINSIPYPLPKNTRQSYFLKYGNSLRGKAGQKDLGRIVKGSQKPTVFRFEMVDFLMHTVQGVSFPFSLIISISESNSLTASILNIDYYSPFNIFLHIKYKDVPNHSQVHSQDHV